MTRTHHVRTWTKSRTVELSWRCGHVRIEHIVRTVVTATNPWWHVRISHWIHHFRFHWHRLTTVAVTIISDRIRKASHTNVVGGIVRQYCIGVRHLGWHRTRARAWARLRFDPRITRSSVNCSQNNPR
ncbi:hypothetical protein T4C_116 [Trichinella pseudospiralis]|uniref:Uncharacterized protein n=1 Tax=Trichinella pseudospiralis TaxID=6337 RepID=A0A0V1K112_TRIPS|nr:hypothetical protein T4C_116 [Trichinella pseudospiralis]